MKLIQLSIPYPYAPSTYPIGGSYQISNTLNTLICRKEMHKGFNKHLLMLGEDNFERYDYLAKFWKIYDLGVKIKLCVFKIRDLESRSQKRSRSIK